MGEMRLLISAHLSSSLISYKFLDLFLCYEICAIYVLYNNFALFFMKIIVICTPFYPPTNPLEFLECLKWPKNTSGTNGLSEKCSK